MHNHNLVISSCSLQRHEGIKKLISDRELLSHYKKQALLRGRDFSTEETVRAVEEMLLKELNDER